MALFTDNDTHRSHRSQFHDVGKGEHYIIPLRVRNITLSLFLVALLLTAF